MANDYNFEELGPRAFEQLTVALTSAILGPGVEAYGSGKDGGREATFDGRINWGQAGDDHWTGHTVIQAKHKEHLGSPSENLTWLKGQIRDELTAWMTKSGRSQFPDNILFVTNVRLSAEAHVGGVDQTAKYIDAQLDRHHGIETLRTRGLRAVKVWHRDTLNGLISNHQSIRAAFPALLTVGDIISRLQVLPGMVNAANLAPVLRAHAHSAIRNDRWIRFGEAGGLPDRQSVEQLIVDLPIRFEGGRRSGALRACLEPGERVLRRSIWQRREPRHLVITGAAGNGKSTIVKYLTQLYRSCFLGSNQGDSNISEIVSSTYSSLDRLNLLAPKNRRWPLSVSLPDMANAMGPSGGPSLLRWLSQQITERASIEIQPVALEEWIRTWPSVIFLDGFDEVTAPPLRQRIIDEIGEFIDVCDSKDADIYIILTTRPTGYTEHILPQHFKQIDLDYLTLDEAVFYGRHVTMQRLRDDISLRDQLLTRFDQSALATSTERLLKTPLQVLILTFILETLGELPANRYHLFWGYYDTVYRREAEKPTSHRSFLKAYRDDITELHERIGLLLHTRCETTGEPRARLPRTELRSLACDRMAEVGHDDFREVERLADQIVEIATQRLVLLAADKDETVSFDVRSLQEMMAARALVSGDDRMIHKNLTLTAPSPHWRNTWLFAAGKLFTEGDHRRSIVLDLVGKFDIDDNDWPGWLYPIGPELASHLLDDGLAANKPAALRQLVVIALRCLSGPMPQEFTSVAAGLSYATSKKPLEILIRNELKAAFAGTPMAVAIASVLVFAGIFSSSIPGQPNEDKLRRCANRWSNKSSGKKATHVVGSLLRKPFEELRDLPGAHLLELALVECDNLGLFETEDRDLAPLNWGSVFTSPYLDEVLADNDATSLLQLCLGAIDPWHWGAGAMLAQAVYVSRARTPVGDQLLVSYRIAE